MQWFLSVGWYSRRLLSANKTTFTDSSGRCGSDVSRQFCAGTFTRFRRRCCQFVKNSSQSAGRCVAAETGFKAVISNCKNTACPLETLLLSASCVVSLIKMASGVLSFSVCVFEVSVFTCTHLYKIKRLLPERIKWLFEMTESWNMLKLHVVTSRDCCWVWETWPNDVPPPPPAVQPTLSSISRVVTHDVPVDVIPRRLWHEFKEPSMPDFDVSDKHSTNRWS